jgi:cellulose synthase operon protein YhjU
MKLDDMKPAAQAEPAQSSPAHEPAAQPSIRLGAWSFYFLAKILLYWRELIGFHPLENIAFAAFLLMPVRSRNWRLARNAVAVPLALALLYYDSWLPPIERALSQATLLSNFSFGYLVELTGRFISWPVVAMLVIGWVGYRIASRYLRTGVAVMVALLALAVSASKNEQASIAAAPSGREEPARKAAGTETANLDVAVQEFYANEAQRNVRFAKADHGAPFDIIFLHVCSLSWDDLQSIGLDKHPIWNNFDFMFRKFNSAASYSGPAAIRINRATCGQTPHKALYAPAADSCYLMPSLKQAGFETNIAFNHDGHFDDFLTEIRKQGVSAPLMPLNGVSIPQRGFDNSPIYDDFGVLSRWFENRQKAGDARVALFYNTISLHDGNRIVSGPDAKLSSHDSYKPRVEKLLNDINGFMDQIGKSGRRAVVVVVPEHGAALRGDKFQIAGLREIPTPLVTTVPVGVKVIGPDVSRSGGSAQISEPTSYVGLSQLIAQLIDKPPYGEAGFSPADYTEGVSATDYVAENEGMVMVGRDNRFYLKQGSDGWKEYVNPTR